MISRCPRPPLFDDLTAVEAATCRRRWRDSIEVWIERIRHRSKSLDTDWDACGRDEKPCMIEEFCKMYNDNLRK